MALQRTIQLRLVRSVFRCLSFLAALGGPAGTGSSKFEVGSWKLDRGAAHGRCGGNPVAAAGV